MSEEKAVTLECDLCVNCKMIHAFSACNPDGVLEEWSCAGTITGPEDEKDIHDALNTIRLCVERPGRKVVSHDWTTWEAQCVSLLLSMAVHDDLIEGQPTVDHVQELIDLGYSDKNIQKKGDKLDK